MPEGSATPSLVENSAQQISCERLFFLRAADPSKL
jgi:hypothetical protein